jgi:acyl-CoA thioesterase
MTDDEGVPEDLREQFESDPYCDLLGIELVDVEPGYAQMTVTVTDDLLNFHGIPHGGMINSLADAAFAAASNSHGDPAFALETNISFLEAVDVGTTLTATAQETHLTRKTGEYEIVVTDDDDGRIATFRGRVYRP